MSFYYTVTVSQCIVRKNLAFPCTHVHVISILKLWIMK